MLYELGLEVILFLAKRRNHFECGKSFQQLVVGSFHSAYIEQIVGGQTNLQQFGNGAISFLLPWVEEAQIYCMARYAESFHFVECNLSKRSSS